MPIEPIAVAFFGDDAVVILVEVFRRRNGVFCDFVGDCFGGGDLDFLGDVDVVVDDDDEEAFGFDCFHSAKALSQSMPI